MQQFQQADNKPELSHELVAGAAAYYAADKYEEHCEANGKDTCSAKPPYVDQNLRRLKFWVYNRTTLFISKG
jgi:hypothetical protein